ncbi:hypothetical protein [Vibrio rumoiensis]|uniref:hypothetical protein n=1 Tax=Vibrio rumoiensis TaxID=76258 RepID=UPI000B5C2D9B|nr:hypothetical protein [Vibrio rumoiensis]
MQSEIIGSLEKLAKEFQEDELAYLALTTKIELPFRDRWAFLLYNSFTDHTLTVSREWKRTDLAILQNNSPKSLIELKAMYTFDAALDPDEIGGFTDAMARDEIKAKKLATPRTDIYTVLLATHPEQVPPNYRGIVKYDSGINRAIKKFSTADRVKSVAIEAVNKKFKGRNVISSGELNGGSAFGVKTSVLYWLVKA